MASVQCHLDWHIGESSRDLNPRCKNSIAAAEILQRHADGAHPVIGNAGGGKSTLARKISAKRGIPHVEVDRLLWQDGWELTPASLYDQQHEQVLAQADWLIDGLGRRDSIAPRIARADEIILIDMPLWMHFWLAAERQMEWSCGKLRHPPGGISKMPPTGELFRSIWEVEQNWMPKIRELCTEAEQQGKSVWRIDSVDALDAFIRSL